MTPTQAPAASPARERLLTIGAVCRRLQPEFPDISISKIRYLEDQGLLTPKRTRGGYRLFGEDDVERLETILRLQRDEFLPLRVIREELAAGAGKDRRRRRATALGEREEGLDLDELRERAGIAPERARELEEFGLLEPRVESGQRLYSETDAEVAAACETLSRYGIAPRHVRAFRTAADRESALLEALVAPALRSRNPERRRAGIEDLQALAEAAQELSQLLFWRNVRRLAGG
jgi:DNA-binding transcriptional MerR regulator